MKQCNVNIKGFSLLEIMVVVAIIGIMASSVVIGFNAFGETVRTRETAGIITDTIKNLELEMIRREYVKQTVNFEEDYLVVEAQVENQNPDMTLTWLGNSGDCEDLQIVNNTGGPVYLAQRDEYDNNMQIDTYTSDTTICIPFLNSEEREWRYQLFNGSEHSQIVRFIHFNIRRGNSADYAHITSGTDYTLEITAPYASKEFLTDTPPLIPPVELTVQNGGAPVTITLQE